ncbi:MAG: amidohydrolase [Ruminococcaceae bacterium]|nr:amidohydrolase [Oscillospiraceae bacterium]
MKKPVSLLAAILLLALLLGGCGSKAKPPEQGDIIYFENGAIYTADEADTLAEALALQDGKIVFVGAAEAGAAFRAQALEVVDLKGGMLLPGFIDAHIHCVSPDFFDFVLYDAISLDTTMQTIEKAIKANPDQPFYTGFGYYPALFTGAEAAKGPTKERLDAICPDKPVVIYAYDGHAAWLNSKGLEAGGITPQTASPPGGEVVLDDATGALWGTLKDSAMSLAPPFGLEGEALATALERFLAQLNAYGYTSIMTLPGNGYMPVAWEGFAALEAAERLSLRVRGAGTMTSWRVDEDLADLLELQARHSGERLKLIAAKIFVDGVVDSESALLLEPYSDAPGHQGESVWTQQALDDVVARLNAQGVQAHFHAVGDGAVRMALDAVDAARAGGQDVAARRNAITHLQLVAQADKPRLAELGVVAAVQPYWHYKVPQYWEAVEYTALGPRAETEYPLSSLAEAGALLAFASDYPVTPDPNPFLAIETAVTRNMPDGSMLELDNLADWNAPATLLAAEERLSVRQAIRGFTANAAYAIDEEDVTGSLEVGKSADLVVIDQDLMAIDPLDISDTRVLRTYFQGRLVYAE